MPTDTIANCTSRVDDMFLRIYDDLDLSSLNHVDLRHLLLEHSVFSRQNVIFLEHAARAAAEIQLLSQELLRNLREELGEDEEHGEHHYDLYSNALKSEVGIDPSGHQPSKATYAFMGEMLDLSSANRPEIVCGSVLASEMAAVPELELMQSVVNRYSVLETGHEIDPNGRLHLFYDMHLSGVEQAHRDGLAVFVSNHRSYGLDVALMAEGFDRAVAAMADWWCSLANQISADRAQGA